MKNSEPKRLVIYLTDEEFEGLMNELRADEVPEEKRSWNFKKALADNFKSVNPPISSKEINRLAQVKFRKNKKQLQA